MRLINQRQKSNARSSVKFALKTGKLKRLPCEYADCTIERTEAHHPDYDFPLEVLWLCRSHHLELHSYMPLLTMAGQ